MQSLAQHAVSQGKHCVDGIGWWTAVAIGEVEVECELFGAFARHFEAGQVVVSTFTMPLNCWKYWLAAAPSIPRSSAIEAAASASSDARLSFTMIGSGGSRWFRMSNVRWLRIFPCTNCLASDKHVFRRGPIGIAPCAKTRSSGHGRA